MVLGVEDDGMDPVSPPGTSVVVDPHMTTPYAGEHAVVEIGGQHLLRKIERHAGETWAVPENRAWRVTGIRLDDRHNVTIRAVVVGSFSPHGHPRRRLGAASWAVPE